MALSWFLALCSVIDSLRARLERRVVIVIV